MRSFHRVPRVSRESYSRRDKPRQSTGYDRYQIAEQDNAIIIIIHCRALHADGAFCWGFGPNGSPHEAPRRR
ncbi:hypothetical protein VTN96DRAFT_953 [Rasamsonia emersonii]